MAGRSALYMNPSSRRSSSLELGVTRGVDAATLVDTQGAPLAASYRHRCSIATACVVVVCVLDVAQGRRKRQL